MKIKNLLEALAPLMAEHPELPPIEDCQTIVFDGRGQEATFTYRTVRSDDGLVFITKSYTVPLEVDDDD